MADFVTLTCPSCGGKLQITPDLDRFACAHCGNEHIVRRAGGVISLAPLTDGLRQIRAGVDKTAAELAVARLTKEIADLECRIEQLGEATSVELARRLRTVRGPLFIGVCAVATFVGGGIDSISAIGGLLLGFIVAGIAYLIISGFYQAQMRSRLDAQIEPLTDRIANRRSLLAKNRQIAES